MKTLEKIKNWKKSYTFFRNDLESSRWESFSTAFYSNNFWYGDQIIKFFSYSNVLPWNAVKTVLYWRKCANQHYSDWFVDECDATMNKLMVHSLKFHMHLLPEKPVTQPLSQGEEALRVIAALEEKRPTMHPDLSAHYRQEWSPGEPLIKDKTPYLEDLTKQHWKDEDDYHKRQQQARKDFIDLLPSLWS